MISRAATRGDHFQPRWGGGTFDCHECGAVRIADRSAAAATCSLLTAGSTLAWGRRAPSIASRSSGLRAGGSRSSICSPIWGISLREGDQVPARFRFLRGPAWRTEPDSPRRSDRPQVGIPQDSRGQGGLPTRLAGLTIMSWNSDIHGCDRQPSLLTVPMAPDSIERSCRLNCPYQEKLKGASVLAWPGSRVSE